MISHCNRYYLIPVQSYSLQDLYATFPTLYYNSYCIHTINGVKSVMRTVAILVIPTTVSVIIIIMITTDSCGNYHYKRHPELP